MAELARLTDVMSSVTWRFWRSGAGPDERTAGAMTAARPNEREREDEEQPCLKISGRPAAAANLRLNCVSSFKRAAVALPNPTPQTATAEGVSLTETGGSAQAGTPEEEWVRPGALTYWTGSRRQSEVSPPPPPPPPPPLGQRVLKQTD